MLRMSSSLMRPFLDNQNLAEANTCGTAVYRLISVLMTPRVFLMPVAPASAADPEIDRLLRSPVGKDWITNGGNQANPTFSAPSGLAILPAQAGRCR